MTLLCAHGAGLEDVVWGLLVDIVTADIVTADIVAAGIIMTVVMLISSLVILISSLVILQGSPFFMTLRGGLTPVLEF